MATFGKATFNAVGYAASRPTYPRQLYDYIFQQHGRAKGARWDLAADVGCGTGQATVELTAFKRVVGLDASAAMIAQAREGVKTRVAGMDLSSQISFEQSSAEELKPLADGSVDLLTAAQACHWFNWDKFWPEAARVLRKDGTLAVWGYSEFRLPRYPTATRLINAFMQGPDPTSSLGPYWEQPGRRILDNHLLDVPAPPPSSFSAFSRTYFSGAHHPALPDAQPVILRRTATWGQLRAYIATASALHTFAEANPGDARRADGDIAARFARALRAEVARVEGRAGEEEVGEDEAVEIEWPLALLMARRA